MTPRFLSFIPFIFKWEGGYDNDPDDPGGETKYGIDKRSHPNEDIRNLTRERAQEIYFEEYWKVAKCELLPPHVGEVVMNIAANCGHTRAARWLQNIVNATPDGVIGPRTLDAAKARNPSYTTNALLERTEEHYRSIGHGRQAKYLKGWLNRNNDLRAFLKT